MHQGTETRWLFSLRTCSFGLGRFQQKPAAASDTGAVSVLSQVLAINYHWQLFAINTYSSELYLFHVY